MAKPEWGTKRKCVECGAVFYDMCQASFACPKCSSSFNADEFVEAHARAVLKNGSAAPDLSSETAKTPKL